jgi:cobalt-precorrin 5A hydrolase
MGLEQAMIVAGIGCKRGAPAPDIEAAIHAALERAGLAPDALGCIATIARKDGETGLETAAAKFGLTVVVVPEAALQAAGERTVTRSERVVALTGTPSVAEAAALAAAGPAARLIGPRLIFGTATCALARSGESP